MCANGRLWMKGRGVCTVKAQVFSPVGSRAQTPLCHPAASYTITSSHHHFLTWKTNTPIHTHHRRSRRIQLSAVPSINTSSSCSTRLHHSPKHRHSWSSPFRFAAKTNSLGHHHQKVRSHLQTAIDRNPRRHSTDPPPRGNDTALIRTRRCSQIANKQTLTGCSQSRGHSSASEQTSCIKPTIPADHRSRRRCACKERASCAHCKGHPGREPTSCAR